MDVIKNLERLTSEGKGGATALNLLARLRLQKAVYDVILKKYKVQ